MANGFDYKSPIDTLLSVTLPRFLDSELNRQERSRQFDERLAFNEQQALINQQQAQKSFNLRKDQFDFQKKLQQTKEDEEFDEQLMSTLENVRSYPDYEKQAGVIRDRLKTDKFRTVLDRGLITAQSNSQFTKREIDSLANILGDDFRDYAENRLSGRVNVSDADFSRVAQNYISTKANIRAEDSARFSQLYKTANQAAEDLKSIIDFKDAKQISDPATQKYLTERFPVLLGLTEVELDKRLKSTSTLLSESRQELYNFVKKSNLPTNEAFNPDLAKSTGGQADSSIGIETFQSIMGSTPKYEIPNYNSVDTKNLEGGSTVRIGDTTSGFVGVINDDGNINLTVDDADAEIIQKALAEDTGADIYVDGNQATDVRDLSTAPAESVETKGDDEDAERRLAGKYQTDEEAVEKTLLGFLTGGAVTQASDIPTISEGVKAAKDVAQSTVSGGTREQTQAVRNARYGINNAVNVLLAGKRKGLPEEEVSQANEEIKSLITEAAKAAENSNNPAVRRNLISLINNTHSRVNKAIARMQKTDDDISFFYDDTVALINAMKAKVSGN
jgi:hypothetical protein